MNRRAKVIKNATPPEAPSCPMLHKLHAGEISEEVYFRYVNKHFCQGKLKMAPHVDQIRYTKKCDIAVVERTPRAKANVTPQYKKKSKPQPKTQNFVVQHFSNADTQLLDEAI